MKFEYDIKEIGLDFLAVPMSKKMQDAVSIGIRDSLVVMETAHKKLFVRGQAKNPQTYPDKIVWRTGALAKSYRRFWSKGEAEGFYGSTLKRATILEFGGRAGRALKTRIEGRFLMKQVEENESVLSKVEAVMNKAVGKAVDSG